MRRLLLGVALVLGLAGCVTDPATDVGSTSATLQGRAVSDVEPVAYVFEWVPDAWGLPVDRGVRSAELVGVVPPALRAVDLRFEADHLLPGATYRYRLCSVTTYKAAGTCFNEQRFTTEPSPVPVDTVRATGVVDGGILDVAAAADPSDGSMDGWYRYGGVAVSRYACISVRGNRALVEGAQLLDGSIIGQTTLLLEDNGGGGRDRIAFSGARTPSATQCRWDSTNLPTDPETVTDGRVTVEDVAPG